MGDLIDLYEHTKKRIVEEYSKDGKLTAKGLKKLVELAESYKKPHPYIPEGYGTDDWFRRD